MIDNEQGQDEAAAARRWWLGVVGFLAGLVVSIGFFAFFPGLPHVIDWGAILVSLAVGGVVRWAVQKRASRQKRHCPGTVRTVPGRLSFQECAGGVRYEPVGYPK
ncbi:hypothetical protein [Streptomyces showdoensis]|uniref:hypothetical protein n=1 Tax=Streptomyces showdoensis TaxID=68268 RepID=UPI00267BA6DD